MKKLLKRYISIPISIRAGMWFTICNFFQKAVSFITMPIFIRIMTTEEYGQYSVYLSWYSIFSVFLTLNLSYYLFSKGMVKYEKDRDGFMLSIQSLNIFITVLGIFIFIVFNKTICAYTKISEPLIICLLIQLMFEPAVLYCMARDRFEYKYKGVIGLTLATTLLNPLLAVVLIKATVFENVVFARAISVTMITSIVGVILYLRVILINKKFFSIQYWRYALTFNIPLIPHFLSATVLNQADRIIIGDLCGLSEAAMYSVAYSIGMSVLIFSQSIQQAFIPWLYAKLKVKDYKKVSALSDLILVVMALCCTIVITIAPEIIEFVGTNDYAQAIWVFPSICGSVYFIFLQSQFSNINYYFENTKMIALSSVGVAALNVFLNYVFINIYGFLAAGYTTLVCYMVYALIQYCIMIKLLKKQNIPVKLIFNIRNILLISILFIILLILINVLYAQILLRIIILVSIVVGIIIFRKKIIEILKILK